MTDTQQALLELLKATLFHVDPHFPANVDWEDVYQEAMVQALVALAAPAVPKEVANRWRINSLKVQTDSVRKLYEQSDLVQLFAAHEIPMVILKGSAASIYYPVPFQRATGDIDFLVPLDHFHEARKLMEQNGYCYLSENDRHAEYRKNGVLFEMHQRFSSLGRDIDPILFAGFSRTVVREIDHLSFPTLPADENGLVLLSHIRQHLLDEGLGLRQVIDWMMYVHAELDDTAWAGHFQHLAKKTGFETLAITLTYLCKKWLGLPDSISWCDRADNELAETILLLLFDNGNLGSKNKNEDHPVEEAIHNIKREGILQYLQSAGLSNFPAAQKYVFLRPFAWLYQIGRYIWKGFAALFRRDCFKQEFSRMDEKRSTFKRLGLYR